MFSSTHESNVRTALIVAVLLAATAGPAIAAGALEVGTCKRDITPVSPGLQADFAAAFGIPGVVNHTDPVFIAGFGDNRAATGYHDRLWARGVVLDRAGVRIAIVSLDLIGYTKNEVDTARALISPASGIDFASIASTHQHEGPDTLGIWGPDSLTSGIDFGYLDFVNSTIADCIDEAAQNLTPARVYLATTDSCVVKPFVF